MCSLGVMFGAFSRNLTELYLTVGFLNGKCFEQTHTVIEHLLEKCKDLCHIFWAFYFRVWLCIDMDPHSDYGELVL